MIRKVETKMNRVSSLSICKRKIAGVGLLIATSVIGVIGQVPPVPISRAEDALQEDFTWWYVSLFALVLGLLSAVGWWMKTKKSRTEKVESKGSGQWDEDALDADKEMEWFKSISKSPSRNSKKTHSKGSSQRNKARGRRPSRSSALSDLEQKERRAKLEQMRFKKLPINSIEGLRPAVEVEPLPLSNDEGLLSAIDQASDEYEEDVEVRELALRVLSKFKTRNSIEAISQLAIYDVSSSIRSEAVAVLAEFDHESVFEAILLACSDPTREVRAAAAKSLFRLSFDRADAWTRLAECDDEFRRTRAARAAIEGELVDRSIDRLIHDDLKYAYEAFSLVALLVKAGETKEIFDVIENRRDNSVKLAILFCLKILKDHKTLPDLYTYIERNSLPEDLSNAANEVIKSVSLVPA